MNRYRSAGAALLILLSIALAACSKSSAPGATGTAAPVPGASYSSGAAAIATTVSPLVSECVKQAGGVLGIATSHGNRVKLGQCLKIPPQNQNDYIGALLGTAKSFLLSRHGVSAAQKSVLDQRFLLEVSTLTVQYQHVPPLATPSADPSPGASR